MLGKQTGNVWILDISGLFAYGGTGDCSIGCNYEKWVTGGDLVEESSHGAGWVYFDFGHFLHRRDHLYDGAIGISDGGLHQQRDHTDCIRAGKDSGVFLRDLYCLAFQYDLACGLFLVVVGIIVLGCNLRIWNYLSPALGLLILLDSFLKLQTSKDAQEFGLETWNWILTFSVIAGIFGVLIIVKPFSDMRISHIINGCGLLMEGFMNHLTVIKTVIITNERVLSDKKEKNTNE